MRNRPSRSISSEQGFTLTELLVSTAVMMIVTGAALGTFKDALGLSDMATQFADANQNLRAGVNQMIKDVMQAGRIIGPEGVPIPNGAGAVAIRRPGPPGSALTFDVATTTNLPDITTGRGIGPTVRGTATDIITIVTVDAFMPTVETPPTGAVDPNEGTIAADGGSVTLPANSWWIVGDPNSDTPPLHVGDLVLFKNSRGMAMQTVTRTDATHIYFDAGDWFQLNQRAAPQGTVIQIKDNADTISPWVEKTSLFRLLMVTYYVDAVTTPTEPRLMRTVNNFTPQALAGVVEDLDFTYDLVDGINNPVEIPELPYTDVAAAVTYNSNQIRKVNIHVGVRSESTSRVTQDYVRNHISTSVDVRSLASVDRYVS
jgi:type II secretory pathway pseudopilin PulG